MLPDDVSDVRIGLCGFTMAFDDYVREYPVVEIQQTFYEPPADGTMRRWRALSPESFEFTLKAWQLVTHEFASPTYRRLKTQLSSEQRGEVGGFRRSPTVLAAWDRTLECALLLRATAVLLQCPRSFRPISENIERMRAFFSTVDRPAGVRLLWEPRGDWPAALIGELCQELGLVHVVDPFVAQTVTPDQTYLRLHGTTGARHVYSDEELRSVAKALPRDGAQPVYVMFNNLPRVGDSRRFAAILAARYGGA